MSDPVHDAKRLEELRALPLDRKIQISQARIIEWYNHYNGNVVVSYSGGKDSTVLLHLVRSVFPNVKAVFSNTGLEYPEIQKQVLSVENVDIIRPSMRFDEVISTYGYPLIGKEVAEAIYYARRIRSHSDHVERERESRTGGRKRKELEGIRERGEFQGRRPFGSNWSFRAKELPYTDINSKMPENCSHGADSTSRTDGSSENTEPG